MWKTKFHTHTKQLYELKVTSSEHGNEHLGFIRSGEFVD
jgi:hypothetical protein